MFSHFASYPLLLLFFILYPCLFLFCLINFIHLTHYYTRFTLILLYLLLPFLSSALYFIYSPFHMFTFCFFLYILVFFFFSPFFCFLFLPYIATCLFLCCRFSFINNIESFFHIIKLLSRFNECGVCLYVYVCVCFCLCLSFFPCPPFPTQNNMCGIIFACTVTRLGSYVRSFVEGL